MAWKRVKDNEDIVGKPRLVGEPGHTYWVDEAGASIFAQSPADFPAGVTTNVGSNIFASTDGSGVNITLGNEPTIKDIFNKLIEIEKIIKEK